MHVQGMGVPLAAVTDDPYRHIGNGAQISVTLVVHFGHRDHSLLVNKTLPLVGGRYQDFCPSLLVVIFFLFLASSSPT
jgi:hypothetical protein